MPSSASLFAEKGELERYTHIGSGNYNAASAKIYTDLGLFTANKDINDDVQDLFNVMTGYGVVKPLPASCWFLRTPCAPALPS